MNKRFFVKFYTNGDEEFEKEYPTFEEAEQGKQDLKDEGFIVDENIDEERV